MNAFEILGGIVGVLLIASVGLVVNSLVMWVVLKMLGYDGNGRLPKCILCCFLMTVVSFLSLFILVFPFPLKWVIFLIALYKLNKMVVEAIFENTNGTTILVVYLVVNFGISFTMTTLGIAA